MQRRDDGGLPKKVVALQTTVKIRGPGLKTDTMSFWLMKIILSPMDPASASPKEAENAAEKRSRTGRRGVKVWGEASDIYRPDVSGCGCGATWLAFGLICSSMEDSRLSTLPEYCVPVSVIGCMGRA